MGESHGINAVAFYRWMSYTGYLRLIAQTEGDFERPNVIVHAMHSVCTPVGTAPVAIVQYKSEPRGYPCVKDVVSPDQRVAAYVALVFFGETAFESYQPSRGMLAFSGDGKESIGVKVHVGTQVLHFRVAGLQEAGLVHREPSGDCPVYTKALEMTGTDASFLVNGALMSLVIPAVAPGWGSPAGYAPVGFFAMDKMMRAQAA